MKERNVLKAVAKIPRIGINIILSIIIMPAPIPRMIGLA
jgi:hypothetical protein